MEYREIRITVSEYGKANVVRQWGGMQYENNNTIVRFDVSDIEMEDTAWRVDFDSPEAGYDPGETSNEVVGNMIERAIPYKFTRFGGEMQATAVLSREDGSIAYSVPVKIYFTEVDRHEETEDVIALNVSELEMSAIAAAEQAVDAEINSRQSAEEAAISADAAKEAADRAEEAANSAESVMQEQLDAKQDKFADVDRQTDENGVPYYTDMSTNGYVNFKTDSYLGFESGGDAPVSVNGLCIFGKGEGKAAVDGVIVPPDADDGFAVNKGYVDEAVANKQPFFAWVDIGANGDQHLVPPRKTHLVGNGESGLFIHYLAEPTNPQDAANKRYVDNAVKNAGGGGGASQEQLDAKQDKFADITTNEENKNKILLLDSNYIHSIVIDKGFSVVGRGENSAIGFITTNHPVRINGVNVYPMVGLNSRVANVATPADDYDAANKQYVDGLVGDIETTLDSVIAIQNALIGGDA